MSEFIGDDHRKCVTHHNACDCREAYFRELEARLQISQELNRRFETKLQNAVDDIEAFVKLIANAKTGIVHRDFAKSHLLKTIEELKSNRMVIL